MTNTPDDSLVLEKLRKLKTLMDNASTDGEAAGAAAAMFRLATKHNLDMESIEDKIKLNANPLAGYEKQVGVEFDKRVPTEWAFVRQVLIRFFNVETMKTHHALGFNKSAVFFIGKKENIEIAKFVCAQLSYQFKKLWDDKRKRLNLPTTQKRNYYIGLMSGMITKLQAEKNAIQDELGLVIVADPKLKEAMLDMFPDSTTKAIAKFEKSDEVIGIGIKDSKNLQINQGITVGDENHTLLLC